MIKNKIGIVIPTLNNLEYTKICYESLKKSLSGSDYVIIFIDNRSEDGTREWLTDAKNFDDSVIVACNGMNTLVNRSWNQGLKIARDNECEYVAFINNDIEVESQWWEVMLNDFDGEWCLCPAFTRGDVPFQGKTNEGNTGFFFVVRTSAFAEMEQLSDPIGGEYGFCRDYDDGLWYEDRDFFERLKLAGHPAKSSGVVIHHYESKTITKLSKSRLDQLKKNNLLAFKERWGYNPNYKDLGKEQLVPTISTNTKTLIQHLSRYSWALNWCRNGRVMDVACGAGYGMEILSMVAREVVGVDRNEGAIDYAQKHYKFHRKPAEFHLYDIEKEDFSNLGKFDAITSFETIEHLKNPDKFIETVKKMLNDDGFFIFSIPRMSDNPWHLVLYDLKKTMALMQKHFPRIKWYSQDNTDFRRLEENCLFYVGVARKSDKPF